MRVRVLGVVVCDLEDGSEIVPARRDRALLAVLALDRNRVWSVDELADAVWLGRPPNRAAKLIRNRVSQLRRRLGADFIASAASGYRLGEHVKVDADELRVGLLPPMLWRGRAFVDLEDWDPAWPAIALLNDLRSTAAEDELAAALSQGAASEAAAMGEALVAEAPLRERRWLLLIRALGAEGRTRDALEAAHRARHAFADVGLDVSRELVAAEREVISGRPDRPRLPVTATSLIGRTRELAAVRDALAEHALVTVVGVGGVGKTALALAAAAEREHLADGVWLCELASVAHGSEVVAVLAATLGVRPERGLSLIDIVVRALGLQTCLAVLDNCEHVIDDVAVIVDRIVRGCPTATILATSREAIGLADERVVAIAPLATGDAATLFGRLLHTDEMGSPVVLDPALVHELCRLLDGLPLAIELAAARARSIPLVDLVERLGARLRLLRADRRSVARHHTLHAMVAWSHDLLDDQTRVVFDRLSVFVDGFTLAAAEAVCADERLRGVDIARAVATLTEKSLVTSDGSGRYSQLETLRQFGDERLQESGGRDGARVAHAAYFSAFARDAHDGLQGPHAGSWWRTLTADWANVRAAFAWAVERGDVETAITIATRSIWSAVWHDTAEPCAWLESVALMVDAPRHPDWASVRGGQAWAAFERGDLDAANRHGMAAIAARGAGNGNIDCFAELALQSAAFFQQRTDDALRWIERAERRGREMDDPVVEVTAGSIGRAVVDVSLGRYESAAQHAHAAITRLAEVANPTATAWALAWEAAALRHMDPERARDTASEARALALSVDARLPFSTAQRTLALLHLDAGQTTDAAVLLLDSLRTMRRRGSVMLVRSYIGQAVRLLVAVGNFADAARLWGAIHTSSLAGVPDAERFLADIHAQLTRSLSPRKLAPLVQAGERLTLEHAAGLAERELERCSQLLT